MTRRAWPVVAALAVIGGACGEGSEEIAAPPLPGSIAVTTVTSGFLKDDGYGLLVNGESRGPIAANAEVTIAGLGAGVYEVALEDVAENCAVDATSVTVTENETASAALSVVCAPSDPSPYTLRFNRARPDLDSGEITECPFGFCPSEEEWDLYVYYDMQTDPHSVIRQNRTIGAEIAHLVGVVLEELEEEDLDGARFGTELLGDPFDAGRVILIRTDLGYVYALGNPVEDETAQTLTFDAVLIAEP